MNFSLGFLLGLLFSIYVLPVGEAMSQLIISKLNIYISKNNLSSTEFAVKTQELVGKESCATNTIGFQFSPKEELDFEFEEEEEEDY